MDEASNCPKDIEESSHGHLDCKENFASPLTKTGKSGKRDRLGQIEDGGVVPQIPDIIGDENNKKLKRDSPSDTNDSISSPNSTLKVKRRHRIYRPRVMESSSEDECNVSSNTSGTRDQNAIIDTSASENSEMANNKDANNKQDGSLPISDPITAFNSTATSASFDKDNSVNHDSSYVSGEPQENETSTSQFMDSSQSVSTTEDANAGERTSTTRNSNIPPAAPRNRGLFSGFPFDTDSDDSDANEEEEEEEARRRETRNEDRASQRVKLEESVTKELGVIMGKKKPKHKWNCVEAIWNRQYGSPANRQSVLFTHHYYDSLHVAQRLELMSNLEFHNGCTNALNFNDSGDLLASGSDDLQIAVWDWCREKTWVTYNSGHRNNVFQCKFLPLSDNTHIVSCARDGQVRMAELSSIGVCKGTRRLAKHSRSAHKVATRINSPYELMSAGEDAVVFNIDIRAEQPEKIVLVKDIHGNRVPLYSIHSHPINDDQFCVSGQDEYVRIYDRRIISPFGPPVLKYCPNHLIEKKPKSNVTCAVYSNNGDAILASYNDEDIYLFDTSLSEGADPAHRYSGHRNSSTVKGVNFFSSNSRFIVSGSDCGNIFIWDRETEAIVNCMPGDENGVVNVLEPHPHLPILATSGLDNDIKVWTPTNVEQEPKLNGLQQIIRSNVRHRLYESNNDAEGLDTHMLMVLFQHLRRNPVLRRRTSASASGTNNLDDDELAMVDSSDDDSDDSDTNSDRVQCSTH